MKTRNVALAVYWNKFSGGTTTNEMNILIYIFFIHTHTHTHTHTRSKVWESEDFFIFFKEVSYAHQGCIYLIKNTGEKSILLNIAILNTFSILIYFQI